jgi:hypothetical protein
MDYDLFEYLESEGAPLEEIDSRFGDGTLDAYTDWLYYNIK